MCKNRKIISLFLLTALVFFTFYAVSLAADQKSSITVAAAANLKNSFSEMGKAFTAKTGIDVTFVFGSTGELTQQVKNGAPVDLFAAADTKSITGLAGEDLIDKDSVKNYAQGSIVLVPSKSAKFQVKYLGDLKNKDVKIIAIANPETAPYGKAAQDALVAAGIWDKIKDKVVFAKNIDETLTYVKTGNADAAIVAKSLVYGSDQKYYEYKAWNQLYKPIVQALGVVKASENHESAVKFANFVTSADGQKIMKNFGYEIP
ncbi:molybdate ABC transporter substrate-binding protein [Candidatus Formimonas warabiya]|uniref:Molybdate ABC transporter substrate-binding protein n=1 Tax=Formimonas warabiya TaxID=1761012 RepID=A0A3G1KR53_FORW1|nr:molybdate ABC transporter substrate-binding protein [Candidatus Formimonas warabiya]ATW24917.1 molybdate ABC transporter substrate-binding protein [Candidatus Formimonas warabiya]